MVTEGSGQPRGATNLRAGQRNSVQALTHQHRVHSWEVLTPAHLFTRELLPHETWQSQDLWDRHCCLRALNCPGLAGSSFQEPGLSWWGAD